MQQPSKVKLNIIVDHSGVECIQILDRFEEHQEGHNLYMLIKDLIVELNKQIPKRLQTKQTPEENVK